MSRMGWGERIALAAVMSGLFGYVTAGDSLRGLCVAGFAAAFAAIILGAIWLGEKR